MGLFRRSKTSVPASRLNAPTPPTTHPIEIEGTLPGETTALEFTDTVSTAPLDPLEELRRATAAAGDAADRAAALAESAQRQALLATETARAVSEQPSPTVTAEQFTTLTAEVERLSALVRASITESREARELVASLDTRITQLGVELANQLDELSGEVDGLAAREPGEGVSAEVVDDLKSGQVRLAQEQARYQIAFRDDLAAIADEMRKRSGR